MRLSLPLLNSLENIKLKPLIFESDRENPMDQPSLLAIV